MQCELVFNHSFLEQFYKDKKAGRIRRQNYDKSNKQQKLTHKDYQYDLA